MNQFRLSLRNKAFKTAVSDKLIGIEGLFIDEIRFRGRFLRFHVCLFNLKVDVETGI